MIDIMNHLTTDCVGFEWNPNLTTGKCKLVLNRFKTSFKELFLENIKNNLARPNN